ncbi:tetratricopeptide repeat protein [Halosquirtibacter laminarini]|uniref:Tetratricopeptide repeat protein n=1 Tax=Halosquirtibacter laminarini TaxID=3374600 RepID=A0AC61NQ75_9BACT|nr:tetratricopeptide repeat protein [Prolixibacteraceae bacterium]
MMKKIVVLIVAMGFSLSLWAQSPEQLFDQANVSYKKGDFKVALDTYKEIESQGFAESDLYYNMGNAYYKLSEFTKAILYYERALALDPNNKNIAYNLKMANQYIVDKVEPLPQPMVVRVKNQIRQLFNATQWSVIGLVFFFSFLFGLSLLFIFGNSSRVKKGGLAIAIVAFLCSIASGLAAKNQYLYETEHLHAIVTQPSVTVKGAPSDTGTELFILHEGIKVQITDSIEGWKEVRIPDGNTGWIPNNSMERI